MTVLSLASLLRQRRRVIRSNEASSDCDETAARAHAGLALGTIDQNRDYVVDGHRVSEVWRGPTHRLRGSSQVVIETLTALDNVKRIVAVPATGVRFIGINHLAMEVSIPGQWIWPDGPP
jgi:hypothetical protein